MFAGIVAASAPAEAFAVLFKCGNVYQDRPCESAADQQLLRNSGRPMTPPPSRAAAATAPAASGTAAAGAPAQGGVRMSCFRAGEHAQLVQWKREGGASREAQLSEVTRRRDAIDAAAVIHQVYDRKGSAAEIRKAVEADCMQNGGVQSAPAAAAR